MILRLQKFSDAISSFSYSNILLNGNFNSTTNWNATNSSNTASNNILSNTGSGAGSSPFAFQNLTITNGRKYFMTATARVTNANSSAISIGTSVNATMNSISSPTQNTWYTLSAVFTGTTDTYIRIRHTYSSPANSNGMVLQVQNFLAIDLTALYGAGNEPSVTDCAILFKFVDGNSQPNFSKQIVT